MRGIGSAAFILGSIIVGWMVPSSGLGVILWLQAILLTAVPFAVRLVPEHKANPSGLSNGGLLTSESLRVLLGIAAFRRVVLGVTRPYCGQPDIHIQYFHFFRDRFGLRLRFASSSASTRPISSLVTWTGSPLGFPKSGRRTWIPVSRCRDLPNSDATARVKRAFNDSP